MQWGVGWFLKTNCSNVTETAQNVRVHQASGQFNTAGQRRLNSHTEERKGGSLQTSDMHEVKRKSSKQLRPRLFPRLERGPHKSTKFRSVRLSFDIPQHAKSPSWRSPPPQHRQHTEAPCMDAAEEKGCQRKHLWAFANLLDST